MKCMLVKERYKELKQYSYPFDVSTSVTAFGRRHCISDTTVTFLPSFGRGFEKVFQHGVCVGKLFVCEGYSSGIARVSCKSGSRYCLMMKLTMN